MKWMQVALFTVAVLAASVAAFTDQEMRQRSWCYANYQCQDGCSCQHIYQGELKMCMCYSPYHKNPQMVCRRKEFL